MLETIAFVAEDLPSAPSRILEVGCGTGDVALALKQAGHDVIAIDILEDAVAAARAKGVDARQANFLGFTDKAFDVIFFTRSLHHIHPLREAVEHARDLLVSGGKLIASDFDFKAMDAATASWMQGMEDVLLAAGQIGDAVHDSIDPLAAWKERHPEHHLSDGPEMTATVRKVFGNVVARKSAYVFRYFSPQVSADVARAILQMEEKLIRLCVLTPVGLQLVATKND